MDEIRKPKRTAGKIVRSRNKGIDDNKCKNTQGLKEECDPKYARIVSFQRAVGIRRAELARLLGVDLSHRNDEWYVIVQRGKGGKQQRQYILPENVDTVREIFRNIEPMENVFSKEELNNKIDFHGLRAENARRNYDSWSRQKRLFNREMDNRPYRLRGDNLTKALASGSPTEYNRLALMCVSVMHLAHWRLDVTVTNYVVM